MSRQANASASLSVSDENAEEDVPVLDDRSSPDEPEIQETSQQSDSQPSQSKAAVPAQKRRRVTRACDECRRKKIKCDGKQPCTHCTVYSYECTYDQPSTRRRNPAPQYIEALESRVHKAEALLQAVFPDLDLTDPRFDARGVEEILSSLKKEKDTATTSNSETDNQPETCGESLLESMVDNTGSLDLDDQGHWDYHGHSSGLIFVQRLRKQFGNLVPEPRPFSKFQQVANLLEESKSASESPVDAHLSPLHDLPSREDARQLCTNAVEDACCIMRFLHKPTFYNMFDRIYDKTPEQFTNEEHTFLPLLYLALAVGCLFRGAGDKTLEKSGYESALHKGFQYFKAGRQLLDITECRDLTSLQAVCFMILFLQSSANISTCYSYIGIALRASLRLGLHRSVSANFNPVELETRKRVFWIVRKMDVHVSTIIGLPTMLSEEDIDQDYPHPVDDEYITPTGILPMPPNHVSLMEGVNAHMSLVHIVLKVVRYIYPVKAANPGSNHRYMVSHSKIRDIERDLQSWMEALPNAFRPGGEASPQFERMRQLLRISYAHVQIIMYRPFLHYVTGNSQGRGIDKRSYACAAACVSVARNVVHITAGMKEKQLLNGSYWFTMYTTYIAILSLLYFILENPESATTRDGVLKDALEGKNALAGLAKKSMAADRCTQSLNAIFKHLPERLRNRQSTTSAFVNRKRMQPTSPAVEGTQTPPNLPRETNSPIPNTIQRASTFPMHPNRTAQKLRIQNNEQNPAATADGIHNFPNRSQPWLVNEHSPLAMSQSISTVSSLTDGDPMSHGSSPPPSLSTSQQHQRQTSTNLKDEVSFSPPFTNARRLPDLMPMMFPSDDPFAYPNQPMSTLEDDHFKYDASGAPEQVAFGHTRPAPTGAHSEFSSYPGSTPSPTYAGIPGVTALPEQNLNIASGRPSDVKDSPQFSNQQEANSSVPAQNRGYMDVMENFDATTMANGPSMWQDLSNQQLYRNQYVPSAGFGQANQGPLDNTDSKMDMGFGMPSFEGLGTGMNMGMGMGMGMDIDELLRTTSVDNNSNDLPADWAQWDMKETEK